MSHVVRFGRDAVADLKNIYDYIAERAGFPIADGYIDRIEATCLRLETFPNRGAPRDDLAPGFRTLAFERQIRIIYRVDAEAVTITHVLHASRDLGLALDEDG